MRTTGRAMLSNLAAWWKELIALGLCVLASFTSAGAAGGFAVFLVLLVGWAIGFSHRYGPIWDTIRRMDRKLDNALTDEKPEAEVRHLHSV